MSHIIVNIKNSVGGFNGRLDTAGEKLVSWKTDWKKLSRVSHRVSIRTLKSIVKSYARQTKSRAYLIGVAKDYRTEKKQYSMRTQPEFLRTVKRHQNSNSGNSKSQTK